MTLLPIHRWVDNPSTRWFESFCTTIPRSKSHWIRHTISRQFVDFDNFENADNFHFVGVIENYGNYCQLHDGIDWSRPCQRSKDWLKKQSYSIIDDSLSISMCIKSSQMLDLTDDFMVISVSKKTKMMSTTIEIFANDFFFIYLNLSIDDAIENVFHQLTNRFAIWDTFSQQCWTSTDNQQRHFDVR